MIARLDKNIIRVDMNAKSCVDRRRRVHSILVRYISDAGYEYRRKYEFPPSSWLASYAEMPLEIEVEE